ncbi:poly-beta-1,6-N-acetyl-D-glucosamine biosynthesis protein PgaD, partial [Stenotrophomonas geniculata]
MNAQRPSNRFDSRMIRKPHRQPRFQRTAWGFVTLAFWGFYFYLWAPLVTLLSWLIGGQMAWQQLYERKNQFDPYVLVALPLMLLCASVLLIGWAEYNRARIRRPPPRQPPERCVINKNQP